MKLIPLILLLLSAVALSSCSSPFGGPDPFDVAIGEAAKQHAAMNARRAAAE